MICNKLKSIRKDYGMSITELSKRAELNRMTIYNIESGKAIPSVKTAMQVAKVFKLNVNDIFFNSM